MKKIIFLAFIFLAFKAESQTNYDRDTLAKNNDFQQRVRISSISAAKANLAANPLPATYVVNYCQLIVSSPFGEEGGWLDAMSYGVATGDGNPLTYTDSDIQFTVNSNIVNYAKAYYRVP